MGEVTVQRLLEQFEAAEDKRASKHNKVFFRFERLIAWRGKTYKAEIMRGSKGSFTIRIAREKSGKRVKK